MVLSTKLVNVYGVQYILAYVCQDTGEETFFIQSTIGSTIGQDIITVKPYEQGSCKSRLILWAKDSSEPTRVVNCRFNQEKWDEELYTLAHRFLV